MLKEFCYYADQWSLIFFIYYLFKPNKYTFLIVTKWLIVYDQLPSVFTTLRILYYK